MDTEIRVSTESRPWRRKFSSRSSRDSNLRPFNHESGALTTELSPRVCGRACLTKGIAPKMCRLCVCVLINKRSFEPFMCLDSVLLTLSVLHVFDLQPFLSTTFCIVSLI